MPYIILYMHTLIAYMYRYFGVAFGLANAWVWLGSNATIQSKTQMLVERIVGML